MDKEFQIFKKSFIKFEWEVEKHLFIEEKAIFNLYNPKDIYDGYKMLPTLKIQHNFIINKLKNWRSDIENKIKINGFYDFKKFILNHKNFEEKEVYPKLDQILNDNQKKHIINRINEII
jgi:hemerythrin superfamily protein